LVAAAIALVAISVAEFPRNPRHDDPVVYATVRGEQRRLSLPDGSDVILGPESRLEVRVSPTERNFFLRTGEAIFSATHNAARPFRVYAGAGLIEDVGTAFAVRSGQDQVTVTVIQGEVVVSPSAGRGMNPSSFQAHLTKNQQVSYRDRLGPVIGVDATLATSWRNGQLSYIDAPLENVIAELRRYSMKDIVVEDQSLAGLRYTGTVSVSQIDQWAVGLARVYPVRIQVSGDRLVLRDKAGDH
jgi:transmembrane sensor